jgi:hypothetical protein
MTTVTLCVYCEQLPARGHGYAAKVMRCPLCHADLGITSSGARFRLVEHDELQPAHAKSHAILISAVGNRSHIGIARMGDFGYCCGSHGRTCNAAA